MRLKLDVLRLPNRTAQTIGYAINAIRIMAEVKLESAAGLLPFHSAVVDTGAPVSMFPPSVWRGADFEPIGEVRVGGVIDRDECRIATTLARVTCTLSDGANYLGPLKIHAYLAASDRAPILLGVADLLDRSVLHCEICADHAYLEI